MESQLLIVIEQVSNYVNLSSTIGITREGRKVIASPSFVQQPSIQYIYGMKQPLPVFLGLSARSYSTRLVHFKLFARTS